MPPQLSGAQFKAWIGTLLERFGFRPEVTQASGDGGIDIVATLDRPLVGGRYLVQGTRYAPDAVVGVPAVHEFYGTLVADRGAVKGLFITTSGFTTQAREFAKTLPIELIDRPTLRELLEEVGGRPEAPPVHPPLLPSGGEAEDECGCRAATTGRHERPYQGWVRGRSSVPEAGRSGSSRAA